MTSAKSRFRLYVAFACGLPLVMLVVVAMFDTGVIAVGNDRDARDDDDDDMLANSVQCIVTTVSVGHCADAGLRHINRQSLY